MCYFQQEQINRSLQNSFRETSLLHTNPVILDFSTSSLASLCKISLFCIKPFIAISSVSSMYCEEHSKADGKNSAHFIRLRIKNTWIAKLTNMICILWIFRGWKIFFSLLYLFWLLNLQSLIKSYVPDLDTDGMMWKRNKENKSKRTH